MPDETAGVRYDDGGLQHLAPARGRVPNARREAVPNHPPFTDAAERRRGSYAALVAHPAFEGEMKATAEGAKWA